ncbi:MAG: UDP-N-acetylmuramate:L-alanyl-gamma-D-glutamyl-meso-diaminopimelate ligase [candidate division KSB1 bacterium]|nr:UDP-N-acetylmuramate:L-alanyl-gamma-D-glutamyl-meso-diaminopimelate ligase [candidate division KSB1 bacterium]
MMVLQEIKRIYFLAIGGTAMGSLAALLKQKGYEVYGSDENVYPPMSDFLHEQQIPVISGFRVENLTPPPDLVIVGNVISRGNVEIEEILDRRIPYLSLPDAVREFLIRGKQSIVVTGTHGKTTTTSLLAWLFTSAGRDPGFLIGGIPKNFGRGFQLGNGKEFIIEGDEYDSAFFDKVAKFLRYMPDIGIINAVEYDHADIYASLDEIKTAFRRFVNLIPRRGMLVINGDDPNVRDVASRAFCPVVTFGMNAENDWYPAAWRCGLQGVEFSVLKKGELWGEARLGLAGTHNIRNALACIAVADACGIDKQTILAALASFSGVKRRLERLGEVHGMEVYDDFGHHPTAVKETLAALRAQHPNRRIWALYEPRSATSRRNVFQNEFVDAFQDADVILAAPVHRPDKAPADQLFSSAKLAEDLRRRGKEARYLNIDEMVAFILDHGREGDLIVTFSNGPFGGIHEKLLQRS